MLPGVGAEGAVDVFLHEMELKSTVHRDHGDRMKRNRAEFGQKVRVFRKNKWSTASVLLANKKL